MLETISLEIVLLEIKEEVERLLTSECLKEEIDHNLEAMQIGNLSNQERIVLKQGLTPFKTEALNVTIVANMAICRGIAGLSLELDMLIIQKIGKGATRERLPPSSKLSR